VIPCERRASTHDETRKAVERLPANQVGYFVTSCKQFFRVHGSIAIRFGA
jgi:hypothetical protein